MNMDAIERDFREKVCEQVQLAREGMDRYRVLTPFLFEDGDHLAIVLRRENAKWLLSDEGHTYMHLTYDIDEKDLQKGTRQKIISNALSVFKVEDRDGELMLAIQEDHYGDALYSFAQALLKITDCPGSQQWANACLIAAAPDLLVACKGAIAALTQNKTHQADIDAAVTWLKRAVEAANNPHREKLAV